jgi:16S rRNA (uracil1498-N3)-methyltransferase
MDDIVDKLTQLGVARIIPLKTQNTVVVLDEKKEKMRAGHWEKVAISAAKQSGRRTLPVIDPVREIKDFLARADNFDLKVIPTLSAEGIRPLKDVLGNKKYRDILAIIGPEGDFTTGEIDLAERRGCIPVSLGKLVWRVETAAVAVTSFIRLALCGDTAP